MKIETEIYRFIRKNYHGDIFRTDNTIVEDLLFLPDIRLGIDYNDLILHNELHKSKKYHLERTNKCESHGVHLVQIYGDDWLLKKNIVKSRLLNLLNKSQRIFARKCQIQEVPFPESKEFLQNSHLQGFCSDKIRLGLYFQNELVSLMTFGKLRRNLGQKNITDYDFELIRFCNKLNMTVVGGANKLFKFFVKEYNPKTIISYADRSWTMNNGKSLYDKLEFQNQGTSEPNYHYVVDGKRKNRFTFRKDVLIKQGFDGNKTEHQIMLDREIYRVFNSGQMKFLFVNDNFKSDKNNLKELFVQ